MNEIKETADAISNVFEKTGKISITKIIVSSCMVLILGVIIWTQTNMTRLTEEISISNAQVGELIRDGFQAEMLKANISEAVEEGLRIYDEEFTNALLRFANENNVKFTESLNETMKKPRKTFYKIQRILLFPEKMQ